MTTINYKINNQTARDLTASDWTSAQTLQQQTKDEEIAQFGWWSVVAVVTNNDGSITYCPTDDEGNPLTMNDEGVQVPYVDTTTGP